MGNDWAPALVVVAAAVGTWIEAGSGAEAMTCADLESFPFVAGALATVLPEQPATPSTAAEVRKHARVAVKVDRRVTEALFLMMRRARARI
ncbi:hypothetical protein [Streptomyces sp. NPDC020917]|uniref:hypothetical protein n=1 Tax=Streptomyces sp. NPDC020917 TaxID=3365102 RepID=UPI0037A024CF